MRKRLFGFPTIIGCGLLVGVMWGSIAGAIPRSAWTIPTTDDVVIGFERIIDAMPTPDTFLAIREVFRQINRQIGSGR